MNARERFCRPAAERVAELAMLVLRAWMSGSTLVPAE
jgi:hypothetical protein